MVVSCPLCPATPTIFSRDNIFQGMLGVIGFLTETGEGPSSMYHQAWVKAASPADKEGTWDIQPQASCTAELRAGGAGASLSGSTEIIVRFPVILQVEC